MSPMPYKISFEDRDDYLYAFLTGEGSFSSYLSYWNEISDKLRRLGIDKVLVHETLTGEVTEDEVCDVIDDLKGSGLINIQIAFYDENKSDENLNKLAQRLATERGANMQIFDSLGSAISWLSA